MLARGAIEPPSTKDFQPARGGVQTRPKMTGQDLSALQLKIWVMLSRVRSATSSNKVVTD